MCYNKKKECADMEDKQKTSATEQSEKPEFADRTWVDDMKQELEDYIEEQGIYIRQ